MIESEEHQPGHVVGPPPRLSAIVARDTPVAAVFRRGPSKRWHIYKWDLEKDRIEPGGVFEGTMYPGHCDVSPDGKLLGYFALTDRPGQADSWASFIAVSKLPWLTALVAWSTGGRTTVGCRFVAPDLLQLNAEPKPFHGHWPGKLSPLAQYQPLRNLAPFTLRHLRRAGIETSQDSPLRPPRLVWADFDHQKRLLTAHADGTLGIWTITGGRAERTWSADLNPQLSRVPSPDWAREW